MKTPCPLLGFCFLLLTSSLTRAETSELWGAAGENWSPQSRLPDFSHAGYGRGEIPIPEVPRGVSVKDFGAKGDGTTDDTAAFVRALAEMRPGALEIPAGRYVITGILEIKRSGLVLRGAGADKTILFFPKPLNEVKPDWSATTSGRRTSNYSWAGGYVWFKGSFRERPLAQVVAEARRGDTRLQVSSAGRLRVGQQVEILLNDNADKTLARELYSSDPGDMRNLNSTRASLVCRITKIAGQQIEFDRPLRSDIRLEWNPVVRSFEPSVTECGVENLGFEFPNTPYQGHFTELGFNAVAFSAVANCWARNLRIVNADSGIFPDGRFCTVRQVVFESAREPDTTGCAGHHGIYIAGDDNLFTDFDFRQRFIHDISLSHCSGNVISSGRGLDLCFDHHKRAPFENLFSDIDAGAGTRLWRCGGGAGLGKHCAARGTFWNIRAALPQSYPAEVFGPPSMNFVAVQSGQPSEKNPEGRWFEAITPEKLAPQNIHAAQVERRMRKK